MSQTLNNNKEDPAVNKLMDERQLVENFSQNEGNKSMPDLLTSEEPKLSSKLESKGFVASTDNEKQDGANINEMMDVEEPKGCRDLRVDGNVAGKAADEEDEEQVDVEIMALESSTDDNNDITKPAEESKDDNGKDARDKIGKLSFSSNENQDLSCFGVVTTPFPRYIVFCSTANYFLYGSCDM